MDPKPSAPAEDPVERLARSLEEWLEEWREFRTRVDPLVEAAERMLRRSSWLRL
jgi:hypothetical protein